MDSRKPSLVLAFVTVCMCFALPAGWTADSSAASAYSTHFKDRTLRVDFLHGGDATSEVVTLDAVVEEGIWSGGRKHLVPSFDRGGFRVSVFDPESGQLLYRRGFDSLFGEYRATEPARRGIGRTFHESVRIPEPFAPVRMKFEARAADNTYHELFATTIDPADPVIVRDRPSADVEVVASILGGDPHSSLDLAILGEGYTKAERELFRKDFEKAARTLLDQEPFSSLRNHINLYAVLRPSQESGCDEPQRGVWRRTALGCRFFSFGSPRYLLTENNLALRETARVVPYDLPIIMVNHDRYGGGGIYNLYCTFTAHGRWAGYLLVHELGHALAGLADEYYTSDVASTGLYPKGTEPLEPNITAFLDPSSLKWRDLVTQGAPVPTPWDKAAFEKLDLAYQKRRQELNQEIATAMRTGAPAEEVSRLQAEAEDLAVTHSAKVQELLKQNRWAGAVGAFEGAGYEAHGLYRPQVDCIMFSKGLKPYCAVCRRAIRNIIGLFREDTGTSKQGADR